LNPQIWSFCLLVALKKSTILTGLADHFDLQVIFQAFVIAIDSLWIISVTRIAYPVVIVLGEHGDVYDVFESGIIQWSNHVSPEVDLHLLLH
jgi:hypothetical protein